MTHKNRAAGFALGMVGLLSMAACGVVPRAGDLVLGYQSTGGVRPAPSLPAPLPAPLAPAPDSRPLAEKNTARPLPFLSALDRAARYHDRGVDELQRGNLDLADVEFHKAMGLLMDPSAAPVIRATYRPLRPPLPADLPQWEDRAPAPAPSAEPEEAESSEEVESLAPSPALISPDDVKAIEREGRAASGTSQFDPARFDLPVVVNDKVQTFIHYFTTRKFDLVSRAFERASRYLPMMRDVFAEKGLPRDLLNLAFIESAFNPRARSRAGATGIWQFIESTGRRFGMSSGFWVDYRRDPELSTRGAAEYLKTLYGLFDSWPLALAAYNAGEGTIQTAIARQKTTDFWKLRLPKETQLFVPAFMAMAIIAKDPIRYGFSPPPERRLQPDVVPLKESLDLPTIARAAHTTVDVIRGLNPALTRGATPPGPFKLRLPSGSGEIFVARLGELPRSSGVAWVQHRVRKGESWKVLARRHRVPVSTLLELNGQQAAGPLAAGTVVLVPGRATAQADGAVPRASGEQVPAAQTASPKRYTVHRGDTLAKIAKAHRLRVADLARLNSGLDVRRPLKSGQVLVVKAAPVEALPAKVSPAIARAKTAALASADASASERPQTGTGGPPRTIRYTVKPGDNLWTIAQAHGVSLDDLKRWNGLAGRKPALKPGQALAIRPPEAS